MKVDDTNVCGAKSARFMWAIAAQALASLAPCCALAEVMSFKDAAKIKSWDAWHDHEKAAAPAERPRVTWDRLVQLNPGMDEVGSLALPAADGAKASRWSVGCECLDRDYAEWKNYREWLPPLGAKRARLLSGWAKTEQERGVYDFSWLDPQVREMAAMGIRPWICLSYGNPVWGSDFRLGMRVSQITGSPEAMDAWLKYVTACVERYMDVVDEWEIWNEPFRQGDEYAELFYRTARAIKAVQPAAKCICTAITLPGDYVAVLERLKREGALSLASEFVYHPYDANPDISYAKRAEPLRALVKGYSPDFEIFSGESGCPAQLEFGHALKNLEWTEYSQAKWLLRRTIGDAARNIPCSVFTIIDLQYTFMLQSFGLIRSNALKEFVYRRPAYFAMQNVFGLIDDAAQPLSVDTNVTFEVASRFDPRDASRRALTVAEFSLGGAEAAFIWYSDRRPDDSLGFDRVNLRMARRFASPVWVEMITGRVFEVPSDMARQEDGGTVFTLLPVWDAPVMLADRASVKLR